MDDKTVGKVWEFVRKEVPGPILIVTLIYAAILFGVGWVLKILTSNDKLSSEYHQKIVSISIWGIIIITIIYILVLIGIFFWLIIQRKMKKNKNSDKKTEKIEKAESSDGLPEGKIDAFIVEQGAVSRDNKFRDINENVKKTYWVLGIGLTSIESRENKLKKMVEKGMRIRLCMMDPGIAMENLCSNSLNYEVCYLQKLIQKIEKGDISREDIKDELKNIKNCKDLLDIYHVLINAMHFNEYYMTKTDYKGRIQISYENLKRIKNSIVQEYGIDSFKLKVTDSFIPMSLTITDAEEAYGRMVVEFHLPFTQYKVWFEISKADNNELFTVFVDFYETVWKKAKESETVEKVCS